MRGLHPTRRCCAAVAVILTVLVGCGDKTSRLIRKLEDEHYTVRTSAAKALANIGPAAKDAVPALTKALEDEDVTVRSTAANALAKIGHR